MISLSFKISITISIVLTSWSMNYGDSIKDQNLPFDLMNPFSKKIQLFEKHYPVADFVIIKDAWKCKPFLHFQTSQISFDDSIINNYDDYFVKKGLFQKTAFNIWNKFPSKTFDNNNSPGFLKRVEWLDKEKILNAVLIVSFFGENKKNIKNKNVIYDVRLRINPTNDESLYCESQ